MEHGDPIDFESKHRHGPGINFFILILIPELAFIFCSSDGGSRFIKNDLPDYTVSPPRRR
jgi:hypothetical protein